MAHHCLNLHVEIFVNEAERILNTRFSLTGTSAWIDICFFFSNKFFGIIWRKVRRDKKSHHDFTTPQHSATPNPPLFRKLDTFTFLIFSLSDLALERLRMKKETFDCLQLELIFSTFIQC